ncbi:MAG: NAD(P)-dependent glycerol-3-phosphate dehydrogenase [Firmicutes bacterium]|nr:NAD(P)-dependent glycerol-3-phosphate dehydrogenase [Bacillota bacterium]
MQKVCILGLGAWGTALAVPLSEAGNEVVIWGRRAEAVERFNALHENCDYLPGIKVEGAVATADMAAALRGAALVFLAVPSSAAAAVSREVARYMDGAASDRAGTPPVFVSTCKGLEESTAQRITEVARRELGDRFRAYTALSGPNFAVEVAAGLPSATVVAGADESARVAVQDALMTPNFRVYTNSDTVGVEIAGALKNVIAIAVGMAEGLGLGFNARAALITRGLAEIARLGIALGADRYTFSGLAGMGDLVLTCTGEHSRNRRAGVALARGETLEQFVRRSRALVEGAGTTRCAVALAASLSVEMPVSEKVYEVLFEKRRPGDVVPEIMTRGKKNE